MNVAKKVIKQILLIYLTTTGIFLAIFFALWYEKLYKELITNNSAELRDKHRTIVLSVINSKFIPLEQTCKGIANVSELKFAILDDKKIFCSDLSIKGEIQTINFQKHLKIYQNKILFSAPMNSSNFYLQNDNGKIDMQEDELQENTLRTIIEGKDISKELLAIRFKVLSCALLAFLGIALISYFLVKIALKPLEDKIKTLNSFIKDFTHEINTPLSVILLSIERIEQQNKDIDEVKFKRMKIAAKTLSQVYSDLIFYTFPEKVENEEANINMKALITERLEYFKLFFEQKKISLDYELDETSSLFANVAKIKKMLDNLISNAIKYNKKGGNIFISLKDNCLKIKDSGFGIEEKNLKHIFDRYARFNNDQGGFGIGLSLVQTICKEYHIKISCTSTLNVGSEFVLEW
ncbi:sensor histidine kinase [Campylobacter sp. MIT 99-7217]|uniref:sensor histidine kinase n=1 Tax=Campylobacter sp. MIT 99-7217 TaxID=535091 RepID=UPI00115AEAF0|nr:HAMP domain-containing sensor histidine kinase [Campylobacter sp. MIT 99-7217]TQR29192.1 sensor histidine kinase [Campylobacter sp. MIT 99-7217]